MGHRLCALRVLMELHYHQVKDRLQAPSLAIKCDISRYFLCCADRRGMGRRAYGHVISNTSRMHG